MNYLLDTHSFLWSLFSSDKLSAKAKEIILNNENTIYVSVITFWEISLKFNLGKLKLRNVLPDALPDCAVKSGFEILNLSEKDAASFFKLPKISHSDPFDRLLIWQAIQSGITVITRDKDFKDYEKFGMSSIKA